MLVRIELNVALARINPLFYRKIRVYMDDSSVAAFFTPDEDGSGRMKKTDAA
jgi:hypothetical protein